jgi:hypothetical protein
MLYFLNKEEFLSPFSNESKKALLYLPVFSKSRRITLAEDAFGGLSNKSCGLNHNTNREPPGGMA